DGNSRELKEAAFRQDHLILRDLAALDLVLGLSSEVERRVVAGENLTRRRVVRTDVARHAAFAFGNELNGRNQLRRLVSVARWIDQPQRSAVPVRQRFAAESEDHHHAWLQQI